MTMTKLLAGSALALAGIAAALPAAAQTVATADLQAAMVKTKAFVTANTQIETQYKGQLDQAQAIATAEKPLLAALDTNKDGTLSQQELQAAQAANNPSYVQLSQKEQQRQSLEANAALAQQYALQQVQAKLGDAVKAVITRRNVSVLVAPQAVLYAGPAGDLTTDITTELDRTVTTVSISPPPGWQPGQNGAAPGTGPGTAPVTPPATTPGGKGRKSSGR